MVKSSVEELEEFLRKAVKKAAKSSIPHGRHHEETPCLPMTVRKMIEERDLISNQAQISELNKKIQNEVRKFRSDRWMQFVEENSRLTTGKIWKALGRITGKRSPQANVALKFDGKAVTKPQKAANKLNRFLVTSCKHETSRKTRQLKRKASKIVATGEVLVSINEVHDAIKKMSNSRAIGPDEMASVHLKHFGPEALSFLAFLIQRSFSTPRIPSNWKNAKVTPLQKPGKPADSPDSYRPISILSPVARIAERVLLPEIQQATDLPEQQHGFRKGHSTVTAVSTLVEDVIDGFNEKRPPRRTIAVALDQEIIRHREPGPTYRIDS